MMIKEFDSLFGIKCSIESKYKEKTVPMPPIPALHALQIDWIDQISRRIERSPI